MRTQISMNFNGEYIEDIIEGYTTTSVSGREMIDVEQNTITIGHSNGSVYKNKRYPSRTLTVSFVIEGGERSILNEKLDVLNRILDAENATIIFADEPDRFYIGTRNGKANANMVLGVVMGSFDIFCPDPFKYSVIEHEVEPVEINGVDGNGNPITTKEFVIDYRGSYKSYPTLEASFWSEEEVSEDGKTEITLTGDGDCGYVAFFTEEGKIIQLGDPEEVDGETVPKSQSLINFGFKKSTSWGDAAKKVWTVNNGITTTSTKEQIGSVAMATSPKNETGYEYCLKPSEYGSGSKWHGPSISRPIPADKVGDVGASNFKLSYIQTMCIGNNNSDGQKQLGAFEALLINDSGDTPIIVAGVKVSKGSTGKRADLYFYVNGKSVEKMDIDLSLYNKYFGNDYYGSKPVKTRSRTSYIEKSKDEVTFNIGGVIKTFTSADEGFADLKATKLVFTFSKWASRTALSNNGLYYVKFVKNNCETFRDIPNKFSSDDIVSANCRNGEILLNGAPKPEYGTLGNDWEEFYLKPGTNTISFAYSDWLDDEHAPSMKMKYREVYS